MSKFKKVLSVLVLAFILVLSVGCEKKPEKGDLVNVTVILASQTEDLSTKKHQIKEGSSAFELIKAEYEVEYTESEFGAFVTMIKLGEIRVQSSDTNKIYVEFIVNGESSQVGVSSYFIKADDILKFKETGH